MIKKSFGVKIEIGNLELYKVSSLSGHDRKTFKHCYAVTSSPVIKLLSLVLSLVGILDITRCLKCSKAI